MAYEPRPGDITIFKNEDKTKDNQPDYTGKMTALDGTDLRVALWIKESKSGKKFLSGTASIPMSNGGGDSQQKINLVQDDLPF